jgi:hypothetical protein
MVSYLLGRHLIPDPYARIVWALVVPEDTSWDPFVWHPGGISPTIVIAIDLFITYPIHFVLGFASSTIYFYL